MAKMHKKATIDQTNKRKKSRKRIRGIAKLQQKPPIQRQLTTEKGEK
jgi:hypothetical protein